MNGEDDVDHTGGEVRCGACGSTYEILEGILDLHPNPTDGARSEMGAHEELAERFVYDEVPEHLRDLIIGDRAREVQRNLPRCDYPELVESVFAYGRMAQFADDYFDLLDWLDLDPSDVVAEIGSAGCWSAQHLAERAGTVVATDISPTLTQGQRIMDRDTFFHRVYCDMMVFPFVEGTLDVIFGVATIHHSGDLEGLFRGFGRALKPGGRAVFFEEPVVGRGDDEAKEAFGAEEKELGLQEHIYTVREYFGAARRAGLRPRVIPLTSLFRDPNRNWLKMRKLGLKYMESPFGLAAISTRILYPFMLQFYPKIPFPRFALVLDKPR